MEDQIAGCRPMAQVVPCQANVPALSRRPLTEDEMSQHVGHRASDEISMLNGELDRLRAELEKAMRIVGTSLHSDVATERIKLENDRLRAENERLQSLAQVKGAMNMILQEQKAKRDIEAENGRLRTAMAEILAFAEAWDMNGVESEARAALAPDPPKETATASADSPADPE